MSGAQQGVFMNQRSFGPPTGQDFYDAQGTFTWVCPTDVTSVSVLVVGSGGSGSSTQTYCCCCLTIYVGGGGGGGGGTAYVNNIPVTAGTSYTLRVGNPGFTAVSSYFINSFEISLIKLFDDDFKIFTSFFDFNAKSILDRLDGNKNESG